MPLCLHVSNWKLDFSKAGILVYVNSHIYGIKWLSRSVLYFTDIPLTEGLLLAAELEFGVWYYMATK